ncbi:MAG TPA: hypothetical protein VN669_13080 [Candidatus Acidoferrales bacterium]|nr:hypothetical protein [Candidatus Acidoferrales bacterium]
MVNDSSLDHIMPEIAQVLGRSSSEVSDGKQVDRKHSTVCKDPDL